MAAGDGPTLIQNSDVINTLFLGDNNAIKSTDSQGIAPLGPQASLVASGDEDVFGTCGGGQSLAVFLYPTGMYLSPPPAQVALAIADSGLALEATLQATNTTLGDPAQDPTVNGLNTGIPTNISTTGVPLLNKSTIQGHGSSAGIAASGSITVGTFSVTQPSFQLLIAASYQAVNGATPYAFIVVQWVDSTSGLNIAKDTFVIPIAGHAALNSLPFIIKGPSKGDTLKLLVYNLDAAQSIFATYTLLATSMLISSESISMALDWKEDSANLTGFSTRVLPDSRVIGTFVNAALAAGNTDTYVTVPASGLATLNFQEAGVAGTNIGVTVAPTPTAIYGSVFLVDDIMGTGNPDKLFYSDLILPNGPLTVTVHNGGSVAASYAGMLVSQ